MLSPAPDFRLTCAKKLWHGGVGELRRRGVGFRESGAFLLAGRSFDNQVARRAVSHLVFYDDLDNNCLESGIIILNGDAFGRLWRICRNNSLEVVADVHTHPREARQSATDRRNPMIAKVGHVAIIVPDYACRIPAARDLGVYEYLGSHEWRDHSGDAMNRVFCVDRNS